MRPMCPGLYLFLCELHQPLVEPQTDSYRTPKIFLQGGYGPLRILSLKAAASKEQV